MDPLSRPWGCQVLALEGPGNPERGPFSIVLTDGGGKKEMTLPQITSLVAMNHLFLHLNTSVSNDLGILNTSKQAKVKMQKGPESSFPIYLLSSKPAQHTPPDQYHGPAELIHQPKPVAPYAVACVPPQ